MYLTISHFWNVKEDVTSITSENVQIWPYFPINLIKLFQPNLNIQFLKYPWRSCQRVKNSKNQVLIKAIFIMNYQINDFYICFITKFFSIPDPVLKRATQAAGKRQKLPSSERPRVVRQNGAISTQQHLKEQGPSAVGRSDFPEPPPSRGHCDAPTKHWKS